MNTSGQRCIVVTGAAGGMGMALCKKLTTTGYAILAIDRDSARLADLQRDCPLAHTLASDLAAPDLPDLVAACLKDLPAVSGLVNLAGVSVGAPIDRLTDEGWDESFAINVTPAMRLTRLLTPHFRQQQSGSIVNVGSPVGLIGTRKPSYAASKAALHGLTMSCARNLGADNIRVNLLLPGPTITGMTCDWDEERRHAIAEGSFLKRLCSADEIAKVIAFLLSDDSSYMTGSVVDMTSGSMWGH